MFAMPLQPMKEWVVFLIMGSGLGWIHVFGISTAWLVVWKPPKLCLDPSDGVFGRFDLAALCGCHTFNVCCSFCCCCISTSQLAHISAVAPMDALLG